MPEKGVSLMTTQDAQAQHRAAAEKIVERIASDPAYRRALLDDPVGAVFTLVGLGYRPAEEVTGYARPQDCTTSCGTSTCHFSCGPGGTCSKTCEVSRRV
jgi:hypothetical protein